MRLFSYLTIAAFVAFGLYSCDRDSGPTMSSDPDAPVITGPDDGQSFELTEDQADEDLFTIEWDRADFGYDAAVEYDVQISETGNNFEDYQVLGSTTETSMTFSVGEINAVLLGMGFPAGEPVDVQIRVMAVVDGSDVEVVSEYISMTITPYLEEVELAELQVPGGYQSASNYGNDWAPDDEEVARLYSFDDDDVYEGYVYLAEDDMFKFTQGASWDVNWGDDDGDGTLDEDGADLEGEAGQYRIIVDLNTMEYDTMTTEWGIIGEAVGGWDEGDDIMMEYDMEEHVWTADVDFDAGEWKFRANETWEDIDYGDNAGDNEVDEGGDNMVIEQAGNYTVTLNLHEPPFSYEVTQN